MNDEDKKTLLTADFLTILGDAVTSKQLSFEKSQAITLQLLEQMPEYIFADQLQILMNQLLKNQGIDHFVSFNR